MGVLWLLAGISGGTALIDTVEFIGVNAYLRPAIKEALGASLASLAGLNIVKAKPDVVKTLDVDYHVKCFLVKTGTRILVRLQVEDRSGEAVFNAAYTVNSERELPYVLDLLAMALREGKDPKELEKTVAEELGLGPKRLSFGSVGLYFGSITPVRRSFGRDVNTLYGGLLSLNYETPYFMGQWATGGLWGKNETFNWPISLIFLNWFPWGYKNISAFLSIGGGLNYIKYRVEVPDTSGYSYYDIRYLYGWGAYAGAGVMFFRHYDFRLVFDVKGTAFFSKVPAEVKDPGSGLDYPVGVNISIALLYHPSTYSSGRSSGCLY